MKSTNRFIRLYDQLGERTPLGEVFGDSHGDQSDEMIEAMYVISQRRSTAGRPVELVELFDAIPNILSEADIVDAAIDVCLQSMMSEGMTEEGALDEMLKTNPSLSDQIKAYSDLSSVVDSSAKGSGRWIPQLPAFFGPVGKDGTRRYELRRVIGSGSQGTMYEAVDRLFGEDGQPAMVALKVFHTTKDAEVCRAEGARARRVRHPNIAQVIDCGHDDEWGSYVAYELIQGQPLDTWVRNQSGKLEPRECCRVVSQIARGIESAHNAGVVHCDLKPSNILMTHDGQPRVTDFGIAHSTLPTLESSISAHGSLAFMAPEQFILRECGLTPSVDVYALGGILLWMLCHRFPNGDEVAEARSWLENDGEPLHNEFIIGGPSRIVFVTESSRLQEIVLRALERNPEDRYGSVTALINDLENFIHARPIQWLDCSFLTRFRLFFQRNRVVVILNAAIVFLVFSVGVVWFDARNDQRVQEIINRNQIEKEKLNAQIAVETERIRQIKEKVNVIGAMMKSWQDTIATTGDEYTPSSLLFLYTVSTNTIYHDDLEFLKNMNKDRFKYGEKYLSYLESNEFSHLHRAQWHELLGVWYSEDGDPRAEEHLKIAEELVSIYAPNDTLWLERIRDPYIRD